MGLVGVVRVEGPAWEEEEEGEGLVGVVGRLEAEVEEEEEAEALVVGDGAGG